MDLNERLVFLREAFVLKGRPYVPYRPFHALYVEDQPLVTIYKTGRQVSKTTSTFIRHLVHCAARPYLTILCTLPLEQQCFRVSSIIFRPLLEGCRLSIIHRPTIKQTLHYKFQNDSNILFSYASDDPDRIRSTPGDVLHVDECQDMQYSFLPVLEASLAASPVRLIYYTGTPKTINNTLHALWCDSSQAEWVIRCDHCGHYNIPSLDHDLLKMLGPYRPDISEESPATICAKCGGTIYPQTGQWVHRFPERMYSSAGYHVPQIIVPLHYADPVNWSVLLAYASGSRGTTQDDFYREILGEASGLADRLLTLQDLQRVAILPPRTDLQSLYARLPTYSLRVLGIDWGGGGQAGNFTTLALVCLRSDGQIEVPWGTALRTPHDHISEAQEIQRLAAQLQVNVIAHDYSGAGALRETILVQSGFDRSRIIPMRYVTGNEGAACRYVGPTAWHPRACYHIEPTRCLLFVIGCIKTQQIWFFADDYVSEADRGLLRHFLNLIEEKTDALVERYYISHEPGQPDEFAQATMLGCVAIWQLTNRWPYFGFTKVN
mgnify:CR=1 FL=1